jgi:RNA polymerase sigma factor (sigma-70 family)
MATLPSPPGDLPPERLFLEHLELIKRLIAFTSRRYRLRPDDAEEFSSRVMVKLIEDNYGVFRKYEGGSSLKTYLGIVIQRQMLDFLNHLWGKWRPSEEAKRLGPVALLLEELLIRDEISFDEAVRMLQNKGLEIPWQKLEKIAARLPQRSQRRKEGEELLEHTPTTEPGPDQRVEEQEKGVTRRRVLAALHRALATLPPEDKLLMLMWTEESVAEISRSRNMEQKPLYRRIDKIKAALRKAFEREGIRKKDIGDILE